MGQRWAEVDPDLEIDVMIEATEATEVTEETEIGIEEVGPVTEELPRMTTKMTIPTSLVGTSL